MDVTRQTTNCDSCMATLEDEGVRLSNLVAEGAYCPECADYFERLDGAVFELAAFAAKLRVQYRLSDMDMEAAAGYVAVR